MKDVTVTSFDVIVTSFKMRLVPTRDELQDYINENFDLVDGASWLGHEIKVRIDGNVWIVVTDNNDDHITITCTLNDAPFVERVVKSAVTRWPWLVKGIQLDTQWADALRWATLKEEIEDAWNEYTDLGFEVGMEDDEEDNKIFALQTEASTRMSLVIDEAKKIEKGLVAYEARYESVD